MAGMKWQRDMDPEPMVAGTVDDLELDIEPRSIRLDRQGKPDGQRRLKLGAGPAVRAEPAVHRVVVAGLEAGAGRPPFPDRAGQPAPGGRRQGSAGRARGA